jgi:hypothetical protein
MLGGRRPQTQSLSAAAWRGVGGAGDILGAFLISSLVLLRLRCAVLQIIDHHDSEVNAFAEVDDTPEKDTSLRDCAL